MNFKQGQRVVERIGSGANAKEHFVSIISVGPGIVMTELGNEYDRDDGNRIPITDPYRSIREMSNAERARDLCERANQIEEE